MQKSESNFDVDFEHPTFQGVLSAAAQQFKQAWLHSPCTMIQPALAKSETSITL